MATKNRKAPARGKSARRATSSTASVQAIVPCLWFDDQAEEAARFYVSVFKKGRIGKISRYPAVGQEVHHRPAGSVMTVDFTLNGTPFTALNGGPAFKFTEAVSFMVMCRTQKEVDHYWEKLGEGGDPNARQCGWLKDKYGLSWQIVPEAMMRMLTSSRTKGVERAFAAMMDMKKLDIAELERAFEG